MGYPLPTLLPIPSFSFHSLSFSYCIFPKPFSVLSAPRLPRSPRSRAPSLRAVAQSSSPESTPSNCHIVSTTYCSDGSVLFRFGHASEVSGFVKSEESMLACGGLVSKDAGQIDAEEVLNGGRVTEILVEEFEGTSKEEDRSRLERKQRSGSNQVKANIVNEIAECEGDSAVFDSINSVAKAGSDFIFDTNQISVQDSHELEMPAAGVPDNDLHSRSNSLGSVDGLESSVHSEILSQDPVSELDSVFNVDQTADSGVKSAGNNKSEINTQTVALGSENFEDESEYESTAALRSLECGSTIEAPISHAFHKCDDGNIEVKDTHLSATAEYGSAHGDMRNVNDNNSGDVIEVETVTLPLDLEPILDEETSNDIVEECLGTIGIERSIMAKRTEEEAQRIHKAEVSFPKLVELELSEDALNGDKTSAADLSLSSDSASLPHPLKALTGGEEACFVACQSWLGVADGVGQWSLEGINAGPYARELMENCEKIVSNCNNIAIADLKEVLCQSAATAQIPGSSTVLIAYFDGQALHVASIGDLGLIIIRNGDVFRRSSTMLHEFSFSLRIERGDDPSGLVEKYEFDLDEGDVIVAATDGLFDNLYDQEIVSIIAKSLQSGLKPKQIAELLAMRAQEVGKSTSARSPFADAAQAAGNL
ncbi:probable protein phosphatase 2C 62 isoform X2 [Malania oleifera]|uniref:probable protein phosphatase 2C 62 isoform X2 n=1 Tax=Malania oleifera TaxID=397392 RepID=UPI0025ADD4DF|nr:probable protein phosphatase 2C 62 isoform X2 [Malania oleifera]